MFKLRTLSGLLAFDAAARHGSLTLAAKELGRTQSAVSQQVKILEEQVGLQLFVRQPRKIMLTPEGRALAKAVQAGLKEIEASVTQLSQKDDPNILRLTTYQSFAIHWLIPRLPRFSLRYPEIDVRINADDQRLNMQAEGIDLALRVGNPPREEDVLLSEQFIPVYAPEIAPDRRIEGKDVLDFRLLAHSHANVWDEWFGLNGLEFKQSKIATDYSHSGLLVQAALAGGGIALAPPLIAGDSLSSGGLNSVYGKPFMTGYFYYIETASDVVPEKVRVFDKWIREEMALTEQDLLEYIC